MKAVRVIRQYTEYSDFWKMDELTADLEVTDIPERYICNIKKRKYYGGGYFGVTVCNTRLGIGVNMDKTQTKLLYYVDANGNKHYVPGTKNISTMECAEFYKQYLIENGEFVDYFEEFMSKLREMDEEDRGTVIRSLFGAANA